MPSAPPSPPLLVVAALAASLLASSVWAQSPPGSAGAKAALKCQQTIAKVNAKFLAQRLKRLAACSTAVLGCVQTQPGVAACLTKATSKCRKQLGVPGEPDTAAAKLEAAIVKACGALSSGDLLAAGGLAFTNAEAACAGVGVTPLATAADLASCLQRLHASYSEQSFGAELPRAAELTGQGGVSEVLVPDLPPYGGCGDCGIAPPKTGKTVAACGAAITKAGATFLAKGRASLDKCVTGLIGCAQQKPDDAGCLAKAKANCQKLPAQLAEGRSKLLAGLRKKCGGSIAFPTLQDPSGVNLGALACECQQVGVAPVASLDDYALCLARQHECKLAALLPSVAPSFDGLLADQGLATTDLLCAPADQPVTLARGQSRALLGVFGSIKKFFSSISTGTLKSSLLPSSKRGTPPRVGRPSYTGGCKTTPGRTCTWRFPIKKSPFGFQQANPRGPAVDPPSLIVGVQRADGTATDDHFEIPIPDTSNDSEVVVDMTYADDLTGCDFQLALAVAENGEVSTYTTVEQTPHVPPANDSCDAAKEIDGNGFFDVVDTTGATTEIDELSPSCAAEGIAQSVWYTVTPTVSGTLLLSTAGSDAPVVVAVYSGGCGGSEVACADLAQSGQTPLNVPVLAGTTYVVQIGFGRDVPPPVTSTLYLGAGLIPGVIGSPAAIANLVLGTPSVNTATCLDGGLGTAFPFTIDYSDPSGGVTPGSFALLVMEHFEPSQREEFGVPVGAPDVIGDAFSGKINAAVCGIFGSDTVISFKVSLVTIGGLSNQLVGALPKPPGAN